LNKKLGISAIIACIIIAGVLAFTYNITSQTSSSGKSQQSNTTSSVATTQQPSATNSITASPPTTTGKHFFAGINETVTIKSNP
jgi:hypothetical protein